MGNNSIIENSLLPHPKCKYLLVFLGFIFGFWTPGSLTFFLSILADATDVHAAVPAVCRGKVNHGLSSVASVYGLSLQHFASYAATHGEARLVTGVWPKTSEFEMNQTRCSNVKCT